MPPRPRHAGHLLDGLLRPLEPGDDAQRDHEIEGPVLEGQGLDIADSDGERAGDPSLCRMPARQLDHSLDRVDGVNAQPALGQGDRHEARAAADLQYP